jgi:hypothetical protein
MTFRVATSAVMLLLLTGATSVLVEQPPNEILPGTMSVAVGTTITAKKGEVLFRQALGRPDLMALQTSVAFTYNGQSVQIEPDAQLLSSKLIGTAGEKFAYRYRFYCTAPRPTGKKRILGLTELGTTGMNLDLIKKLRFGQTQNCVVDSNGNGRADKAFVADTGDRTDLVLVDIPETSMRDIGAQRMPGESEARLVFDGAGGIFGNLALRMAIVEEGKPLAFGNGQRLVASGNLPAVVNVFGAQVTVLSYDTKAKTVEVRIDRGFAGGPYQVQTTIERR